MAGLCEGGNEPSGSLKAISTGVAQSVKRLPAGLKLRSGAGSIPAWADYLVRFFPRFSPTVSLEMGEYQSTVVVITEDFQNAHLLLEYRPHIDVSLTCEHDPKLQEYCVCPQNMPQLDSEGI
ncbi:hypothetical protein ANN_11888 [Periplaneta americana]|uniref:Uncharacterized protein n=1 Tax=Periplaneta americana TaxID=6978 RepID=A0ABQ8T7P3_PERAM|nr:hypothetical protein ANN_11888 [Periplaneta americana]